MVYDKQTNALLVAGVDEAGRGPLAGEVVAAAVILDPEKPIEGLTDSKKLSEKRRNTLEESIKARALCWSLGAASVEEIDRLNILWASMLAMQRAIEALAIQPALVKIDGNRCPDIAIDAQAIVGGDTLVASISAASILAKVERDRRMLVLHNKYPQYGFDRHKGYPTRAHRDALMTLGAIPEHRRSFGPVRKVLDECKVEVVSA